MIDIRSFFNQALFPQQCLLCGDRASHLPLCTACRHDLPWLDNPCCPVCALPTADGATCGACLKKPPAFDATRAVLQYAYPFDALLRRHKYGNLLAASRLAGALLADHLDAMPLPDLLIPMPLHPLRLRERGFNQASEIARVVGQRLNLPVMMQACQRTRNTPSQAGLPLAQRRTNLKGAFTCTAPLSGRHVALVDDVMTTGASLDALARTVRQAGAAWVDCWVVARKLRD